MAALPSASSEIGLVLRSCITWAVAGAPSSAIDTGQWEAEIEAVLAAHLSPVALRALDAGKADPSGELRRVLAAHAAGLRARRTVAELTAKLALRGLHERGIPFVLVKGPAVARFHPQPQDRAFTDLDLVVRSHDVRATLDVLDKLDYFREAEELQPWPWFEQLCIEGVNLHHGTGGNVDLHHHLSPWVLGRGLPVERLIDSAEPGEVANTEARLASAEHGVVVALLHVVNDLWKGDPSLQSWRDIVVLCDHLGDPAVHRAFRDAGLPWAGPLVVAARDWLFAPGRSRVPEVEVPAATGRRLRMLGWEGSAFAARHPIGWAVRLPMARAAAFVAGHAVPSPAYARAKHPGYLAYWRRSLRTMLDAARGVDYRHTELWPTSSGDAAAQGPTGMDMSSTVVDEP